MDFPFGMALHDPFWKGEGRVRGASTRNPSSAAPGVDACIRMERRSDPGRRDHSKNCFEHGEQIARHPQAMRQAL